MSVPTTRIPERSELAKLLIALSPAARRRLKWMDYYAARPECPADLPPRPGCPRDSEGQLVEEIFGWAKTVALLRKTHRS